MSKFCTNPGCSEYGTPVDDGFVSCPYCGSNLANDIPTGINLGDANAISGGININQSKNVSSHDTHYHSTVIQERAKSEGERILDAANELRAKAQAIMSERGRLDSTAMAELKPLGLKLGVDDDTFKSIIKEVRSNRVGASNGLNAANGRYLLQAQQAVQTNDMDALSNLTPRLEAMAAISQDDSVQYLHYMTLCILYPIKSMEVYEKQTDENYWRTFWAIVSYIRTGKYAEATKMLTQFDPVRYDKSEEDLNLLEAYFNFMKGEKDDAQEFLDEILDVPSLPIQMLLKAIEAKLYEEEPQSLEAKFYCERVLQKADVVVKSKNSKDIAPTVDNKKSGSSGLEKNIETDKLYQEACSSTGPKRVMLLQKAADAGSIEAMFDLSNCYMEGEDTNENIPLAIKWMQKSADAGYTRAQTTLGGCYVNGFEGFDPNLALAEKYLLLAAEKEDIEAQSMLANLYLSTEDYDKSIVWARKGAQHDDALACFALGRIYEEGLGVDVNHLEALKWFEKSADNGDADAQNIVGNMYRWADFVDTDYQKAFKYYQKAAVQGNADAMWNLACAYHKGEGVAQDENQSQKWLKDAADLGHKDAIEILSRSNEQELHNDEPLEEINNDTIFKIPDDVDVQNINNEYFIGRVDSNNVFIDVNSVIVLNETSEFLLSSYKICQYFTIDDMVWSLLEAYEVEEEVAKNDVISLVRHMFEAGFVCIPDYETIYNVIESNIDDDFDTAAHLYGRVLRLSTKKSENVIDRIQSVIDNKYGNGVYDGIVPFLKIAVEYDDNWAKETLADILTDVQNLGSENEYVDYDKGFQLYMETAETEEYAMVRIGWCYENGRGVDKNPDSALEWYQKALDNGYQKDDWITERIDYCKTQSSTDPILKEAEVAVSRKDYALAYKKFKEAVDKGHSNASNRIEEIYNEAWNYYWKQNNCEDAIAILKPFAEAGHVKSMGTLGSILVDGQNHGSKNAYIDYSKGFLWYMKAAETGGNSSAMANVGWCYENGRGVEENLEAALEWYQKALDSGYQKDDWITERMNQCQAAQPEVVVGDVHVYSYGYSHHFNLDNVELYGILSEECRIRLDVAELPEWQRYNSKISQPCANVGSPWRFEIWYTANEDNFDIERGKTDTYHYALSIVSIENETVLYQTKGTYCVKRVPHMFKKDEYVIL